MDEGRIFGVLAGRRGGRWDGRLSKDEDEEEDEARLGVGDEAVESGGRGKVGDGKEGVVWSVRKTSRCLGTNKLSSGVL